MSVVVAHTIVLLKVVLAKSGYSCFADCSLSVVKDSPLDVAIIFGMDMSAKLAEHCCCLIEKNGIFAYYLSTLCFNSE